MGVTINKKKATGDWYVWISYKGQRTSRKIGKDCRTAMKAATMYRKKLVLGEIDFSNGRNRQYHIFGEFYNDYINNVAKHRLKYNTWRSYEKRIKRHVLPVWKNREINSITRQEVKQFLLEKRAKGLVVDNLRVVICAVFTEAVEREIIPVNPAHRLGKLFRNGNCKTPPKVLSKEQVGVLLQMAQLHAPKYYDFIVTAFRTGMRLGELQALAWDSVNFYSKQIVIQRSVSHYHWDTPKSHKIRYIDMTDTLLEVLQRRYDNRNPELTCKSHKAKKIYLVFANDRGEPFNQANFRHRVFYPLLAKAGLPQIRIHDIRHTFASQLLQAGAPIHYVKDQLGHSSIATTVDLYGHCQPGVNRAAINKLD